MSANRIQPGQIREIHAIKTRTRLDEASYRAMLEGYGVNSSKYMTSADAERLLARLRDIPGASRSVESVAPRTRRGRQDGPYAKKIIALWLALYNLGEART